MKSTLVRWGAVALMIGSLAGCGGGGGGGRRYHASSCGVAYSSSAGVQVPPGTPVNAAALTPAQFAALTPIVPEGGVSIASAPKVTFSLTDGATATPIIGFGSKSQSSTATVASYPNLAFALAKLVPGRQAPPRAGGSATS